MTDTQKRGKVVMSSSPEKKCTHVDKDGTVFEGKSRAEVMKK